MRSLSKGLTSVRVLIVLDDVDNIEQLDALLPTKDSFAKGSLAIVTTREREALQSWGISLIYKMEQMDPLYAKELFCWHAFLKSYPPNDFNELVEKFIKVCNGLPLSLKVFGSQLYNESRKGHWESQLHKISRILPKDIKEILKISYNSLDDEEKEMFLDIACFFIGEECSLAIEVWNGLGWSGLISWERLLHKCLVEVDNNNCIRMHDHLRDLGRDIAHKQLPYRLHLPQQIINFEEQKKRISIQGMVTTTNQIRSIATAAETCEALPVMVGKIGGIDEFNPNQGIWSIAPSLPGLKYLVISGDHFNAVLNEVSRDLIWLRWFQMHQQNLPPRLLLKNLRVLELCEDVGGNEPHLEELWGENDEEVPVQLRQLLISGCIKLQGLPKSIGHLKHLRKIVISHGQNLSSLKYEFCLLQSLECLVLCSCYKLSSVPNNFGNLRNLSLSLMYCGLKRLPISFKNLTLLEHLSFYGCRELTLTSEDLNFLENTTTLVVFNISCCLKVEKLPHHITNQASLKELQFRRTSLRELPHNIEQLSRLRKMKIQDVSLTSLPTSFGDLSCLTNLKIRLCNSLERLPDSLGDLSCLTNLKIKECKKLHYLPKSIRQLSNLQDLSISGCPVSQLDFGAASLPFRMSNLKKIFLEYTKVCSISFSEDCCPHLEQLYVFSDCLKEIEMIRLNILREFTLHILNDIEKIEGLENCTRLEGLTINGGLGAQDWKVIKSFEHIQNLKYLHLQTSKGSDIYRCIQAIQKWPDEVMICAPAVHDAASLVHSLLPPNVVFIHSISNEADCWPELCLENPSSCDWTFIFCFVITLSQECTFPTPSLCSVSSAKELRCRLSSQEYIPLSPEYKIPVYDGRWTLVGKYTQRSRHPSKDVISLLYGDYGKVERGLVWRGEENVTAETFRSLLPLFQSHQR